MIPIIIGGCGRSGTTLLSTLLSCHPAVYVMSRGDRDQETNTLCRDLTVDDSSLLRLEKVLRALPDRFVYWCEKSPKNIHRASTTLEYFGERARFLNIVRDGRDVVTSVHPSNPRIYWITARRWITDVRAGTMLENHPQFLTIRYEDLVRRTEETLRQVCEFIGMELEPDMLDYPQNARVRRSGAWFGGKAVPVHERSIGRWSGTEHSVAVVRLLAIPEAVRLLQRYGYLN